MNTLIKWPQGPITEPDSGRVTLEWRLFLQDMQFGLNYLNQQITQITTQAGVYSAMLNMSDDENSEFMIGPSSGSGSVGPTGPAGAQGQSIPGLDGQDGEDNYYAMSSSSSSSSSFNPVTNPFLLVEMAGA